MKALCSYGIKSPKISFTCFLVGCAASAIQGSIYIHSPWSPPTSGYEVIYDASKGILPAETNWTTHFATGYNNADGQAASITNGLLHLTSTASGEPLFEMTSGFGLGTGNSTMTIDFRMKLAEISDGIPSRFAVYVNRPYFNGTVRTQAYSIRFSDTVEAGFLTLTPETWHNVRVLLDCVLGEAKVYLDGNSTAASTVIRETSTNETNYIKFGDGSVLDTGDTWLEFLAFTNTEKADLTKIRTVPDFGVTLNDDGNSFFSPWAYIIKGTRYSRYSLTASASTMLYEAENLLVPDPENANPPRVSTTIAGKIDTLMVCTALGSENTWWDTRVIGGSRIGWMFDPIIPGDLSTYSSIPMVDYGRAVLAITGTNRAEKALHPSYTNDPMDLYYFIAKTAQENGIRFFPSIRMNDQHFSGAPWNINENNETIRYPGEKPEALPSSGNWHYGTGRFWVNHNGKPSSEADCRLKSNNRFDYGQAKFRSYRLAMIHEILERYGAQMSGIELDFSRSALLFNTLNNAANKALLTDMLKEIRAHLDDLERLYLRQYYLVVRVATTMANSQYSNMDVATWLSNTNTVPQLHWTGTTSFATNCPYPLSTNQEIWTERLVDVVIPGSTYDLASDMPIYPEASDTDDYIEVAHDNGAKVYPAIFERSTWNWPFYIKPTAACYTGALASWRPTPELIAGAVANYINMGCDGFQMFNYRLPLAAKMTVEPAGECPLSETVRDLLFDTLNKESFITLLANKKRVYAITPPASKSSDIYIPPFSDWPRPEGYVYRKQLPRIMNNSAREDFKFYIGEDFADTNPGSVYLRLGLAAVDGAMRPDYDADFTGTGDITVRFGSTTNSIYRGSLANETIETAKDVMVSATFSSVPRAYFQCEVPSTRWGDFTSGENLMHIIVSNTETNFAIVSVELGVFPPGK